MKQLTYLNPGLTIHVDIDYNDKRIQESYCNPNGLYTYLEDLSKNKELLSNIWQTTVKVDEVDISLALVYTNSYSETMYAYTNNVLNAQGGSHLTGLKEGISRAITSYYEESSSNKSKVNVTSDDTREGIISVMSIKVKDPNFDGQGKAKLNMPKVRTAVRKATEEFIEEQLDKSPEEAKIILAKVLQAQKAREAAKRAREASRTMKGMSVSKVEKLTKCISKNPEEISLWLVEGKA